MDPGIIWYSCSRNPNNLEALITCMGYRIVYFQAILACFAASATVSQLPLIRLFAHVTGLKVTVAYKILASVPVICRMDSADAQQKKHRQ